MDRDQQPTRILFATGMIALGILGLVVGDFALQWQPVPDWLPRREAFAYVSAIILLACGIGLLFRRSARRPGCAVHCRGWPGLQKGRC